MSIIRKPHCLSVSVCLREREYSNSKSPFYKDCSPGLVKSSRASDQLIYLVLEKKTEAVNAYHIKNSKGEEGKKPLSQAVGKTGRSSMDV